MGIGAKIKEYRMKAGLTQKELADELHVTFQAVSRWENDDAEPSFDMLRDICRILNCSTDELFEIHKQDDKEENPEKVPTEEKTTALEQKPILGVCDQCHKPLLESGDLNYVSESVFIRRGRRGYEENRQRILCNECNEIRLLENQRRETIEKRERESKLKARRIHSFIWPAIVALILIGVAVSFYVKNNAAAGAGFLWAGVLSFPFLGTMILNNTFVPGMWAWVTSWGFVKLPGIIFSFSLDGFIFLIVMKILFFLLEIGLSLLAVSFATALAMAMSLFVYPFAIRKNLKGVEE